MIRQIPLLFLGDNPAIPGGLSRIGRDLAFIASGMEEFRVGFLGRGGLPSSKFPWMQYAFPEYDQWGEAWLEPVWNDFAGNEPGILMTIWDPSRLMWLGDPIGMPNENWLRNSPFEKWGYFPVDSTGPNNKLTITSANALNGFDRILAYTMFGAEVLSNTTKSLVPQLYHGIKMNLFKPQEKEGIRIGLGIPDDTKLIGIIMTNQVRKDWGLAFEILSNLKASGLKFKVWCKTDSVDRHWDLRNLAVDFGVVNNIQIDETYKSDKTMAYMYSACDITLLPSLGEGFGYPLVESLACGTPVIHINYAGGAEILNNPAWLIEPVAWRYETRNNCLRPVFNAKDWSDVILNELNDPTPAEACVKAAEYFSWDNLKQSWIDWFREGIKNG